MPTPPQSLCSSCFVKCWKEVGSIDTTQSIYTNKCDLHIYYSFLPYSISINHVECYKYAYLYLKKKKEDFVLHPQWFIQTIEDATDCFYVTVKELKHQPLDIYSYDTHCMLQKKLYKMFQYAIDYGEAEFDISDIQLHIEEINLDDIWFRDCCFKLYDYVNENKSTLQYYSKLYMRIQEKKQSIEECKHSIKEYFQTSNQISNDVINYILLEYI